MSSVLQLNELDYERPEALSVVKSRTQVREHFEIDEFIDASTTNIARCNWSSGESCIDVTKSYLSFYIDIDTTDGTSPDEKWDFGSGSVMNIFDEIIVRSGSGTELCRVRDPAVWSKVDFNFRASKSEKATIGSMMGSEQFIPPNNPLVARPEYFANTRQQFIIPLKYFCPMFNSDSRYLPPQLAEGLYFEIRFQNFNKVVQTTSTILKNTYDVSDIHFMLDACIMNDQTQKELNNRCEKTGLEWVCKGVYNNDISLTNAGEVTNQVNYSCSQATKVYTVLLDESKKTTLVQDPVFFEPSLENIQYRSGADYYPKSKLQGIMSSYYNALYTFDKVDGDHCCWVPFVRYALNTAVYATTLNTSDELPLSGVFINNSKTLEFTGRSTYTLPHKITTVIEFTKIIKVHGRNVAVAK